MNIYRFINSKDVRQYLIDLKYEFNSLEAAWLIYQCYDASLEEKWAAWEELIRTMPDCRIEARPKTFEHESLHEYLREYISIQRKYLLRMRKPEKGTLYSCEVEYGYFKEYSSSDYRNCMEYVKTLLDEGEAVFVLKWYQYTNTEEYIELVMQPEGKLMGINASFASDEENRILNGVFDGLWFDFPMPFQLGDIVMSCTNGIHLPHVVTRLDRETSSKEALQSLQRSGDSEAMQLTACWNMVLRRNPSGKNRFITWIASTIPKCFAKRIKL